MTTREEFDRHVERFRPEWVRSLRRRYGRAAAEDIAQDVVVKLYEARAWDRFQGKPDDHEHLRRWLRKWVKRVAANWTRREKRRRAVPLFDDVDVRLDPSSPSGFPTPVEAALVLASPTTDRETVPVPASTRLAKHVSRDELGRADAVAELDAVDKEDGAMRDGMAWAPFRRARTSLEAAALRAEEDAMLERLEPASRPEARLEGFVLDLDAEPAGKRGRGRPKRWDEWELRMLLAGWYDLQCAIDLGLQRRGLTCADAEFLLELDTYFRTFRGFGGPVLEREPRPAEPGFVSLGQGAELDLTPVTQPDAARIIEETQGKPGRLGLVLTAHYWGLREAQIRGALDQARGLVRSLTV